MKLPPLSDSEIARRVPVWAILSETFLDTELNDQSYVGMARQLAASDYTLAQLEEIYRTEVAPAFLSNLIGVAGEWAGWSDDFVREQVLKTRGSLTGKLATKLLFRDYVASEWAKLEAKLVALDSTEI